MVSNIRIKGNGRDNMVQTPGLLKAKSPRTLLDIELIHEHTRKELSKRRRIRNLARLSMHESVIIVTDEKDVRQLVEKFINKH